MSDPTYLHSPCSLLHILQNFPPTKKTYLTLLITALHLPQCNPTLSWPHLFQPILSAFSTSGSKCFCSVPALERQSFLWNHNIFMTDHSVSPFFALTKACYVIVLSAPATFCFLFAKPSAYVTRVSLDRYLPQYEQCNSQQPTHASPATHATYVTHPLDAFHFTRFTIFTCCSVPTFPDLNTTDANAMRWQHQATIGRWVDGFDLWGGKGQPALPQAVC